MTIEDQLKKVNNYINKLSPPRVCQKHNYWSCPTCHDEEIMTKNEDLLITTDYPSPFMHNESIGTCKLHGSWKSKYTNTCPKCHDEAILAKRSQQDKIVHEEAVNKIIEACNIPIRYKDCTFDNYIPDHGTTKHALEVCKRYVSNIENSINKGKGLLFIGSSGLGKTHLVTAIMKSLANNLFTSTYLKHYELINNYKSNPKFFNEACNVKLLIIDEIGIGDTDFNKDITYQIIDKRYDYMKPTILISNLIEKDFNSKCSLALQSRLAETSFKVIFEGEDYRRIKK